MTTPTPAQIEAAARQLVSARLRRQAAKQALKQYRIEYGGCRDAVSEEHPWGGEGACFQSQRVEWCPVCLGSQPLWKEYRQAANEAGSAMRALMHLVKVGAL